MVSIALSTLVAGYLLGVVEPSGLGGDGAAPDRGSARLKESVVELYRDFAYEAALTEIERARQGFGLEPELAAWLLLFEGILAFELGDAPRSALAFAEGLRLDPDAALPVPTSPRAEALFAQVRSDRAAVGPPTMPPTTSATTPSAPQRPLEVPTLPGPGGGPAPDGLRFLVGAAALSDALGPSVGLGAEAGVRSRALEAKACVLIGANVGLALQATFTPLSAPIALGVGLRGTVFPARRALGGGPVISARLPLTPLFGAVLDAAYERFAAPATHRSDVLLLSLGLQLDLPLTRGETAPPASSEGRARRSERRAWTLARYRD